MWWIGYRLRCSEPADEYAVRIGGKDNRHRGITALEHVAAGMLAQPRDDIGISRYERRNPPVSAPKPRSNSTASQSSRAQWLAVGRFPSAQCAAIAQSSSGRPQRDPLIQPFLSCSQKQRGGCGMRFHAESRRVASRPKLRGPSDQAARLARVAREFGDGAKRAEAPLRVGIGDFPAAIGRSPEARHGGPQAGIAWA